MFVLKKAIIISGICNEKRSVFDEKFTMLIYIKIKINKFWLRVPFVQLGTTDIYVDVGSETVI